MSQVKAVGRSAPALKYDILTALMVLSAHDGGVDGRLAGRLTLLITARFNWQRGSVATGLREIARLWGVTERTAKREMAALKARGLGSRCDGRQHGGRVTEYGLDLTVVLDATRAHWAAVGPDFVARMGAGAEEAPGNVVPFQTADAVQAEGHVGTLWPGAAQRLAAADGATYTAWFVAAGRGRADGDRADVARAQQVRGAIHPDASDRAVAGSGQCGRPERHDGAGGRIEAARATIRSRSVATRGRGVACKTDDAEIRNGHVLGHRQDIKPAAKGRALDEEIAHRAGEGGNGVGVVQQREGKEDRGGADHPAGQGQTTFEQEVFRRAPQQSAGGCMTQSKARQSCSVGFGARDRG